ncbi:DUF3083 family protein [Aliiglaciecola sp. CAU 1673]|uniref:DUF3083 family protein n=1 Tax=Aliiglaciecola sp. CAU 1673 TaxID=3032595 RepID=UPI0023DC0973|nr:DUF3083 family protein [Aliiglaciecola sp. CAU 1673]MDF2179939.1 DUF3083 family protein [Aliiglaciecola sp. CAU 1673]
MASHNKHRVYIPTIAKSNQYLLAEIRTDESFYQGFASAQEAYETLSQRFFALAEQAGLHNVHMIANDKLPVVRYHHEAMHFQTNRQILFFYDPAIHEGQNLFVTPGYQARKIRLLFLATGADIRSHSAQFHQQVMGVIEHLKSALPTADCQIKIRDHQHLSYDLFAREKGHKETYGYKLRGLYPRYKARQCELPQQHSAISYVTLSLPLTRGIKEQFSSGSAGDFAPLYLSLEELFLKACGDKKLDRLAMVANGLTPLVRNSQVDRSEQNGELQKISFDPDAPGQQFIAHWDNSNLVETAHFIVVAGKEDNTEFGYGQFMNRVQEAVDTFAKRLGMDPTRNVLTLRFHQHISYIA